MYAFWSRLILLFVSFIYLCGKPLLKPSVIKIIKKGMYKKYLTSILAVVFIWIGLSLIIGILLSDDFPGKIWLHRCNSMEKLYEQDDEYPNVEIDVVFRENRRFDVTHDVDTSFNLSLDPYFFYMDKTDGKMWLDVKNLTKENKEEMLAELNRLVNTYHIEKDELIIESRDWRALALFTRSGYYTSYYVPFDAPQDMDDKELNDCIIKLRRIADHKVVRALSFPGWWYPIIKERLDRSIDLLTWKHRTTQLGLLASPMGWRMLNDNQLKVILVKDKGEYHR